MKRYRSIVILVFLASCVLASAAGDGHNTREPTALEAETFVILKKKFPREILTANLKELHELAEASEYKNFLKKAYPNASLPPAFVGSVNVSGPLVDDTLYRILPSKKHYLTYYTEYFQVQTPDEVNDAEHFIVHHEVTGKWIYEAIKRSGDTPAHIRTEGIRLTGREKAKLVQTVPFKEMMKRRFGIEIQGKPDVRTSVEMMPVYEVPTLRLASVQLAADIHWMQALFEQHGASDGIIWIALQDPALFSRIRYAFTTDKTLLHFISKSSESHGN